MTKQPKLSTLTMLFVLVLTVAACFASANAQGTATVTVNTPDGGTTDVTGTTTYADGSSVTITATPDQEHVFATWIITPDDGSGTSEVSDNPVTFTVTGGVTYTVTASFAIPTSVPGRPLPADLSNAAIVIILPSAGGTTTPGPGTYALANAEALNLVAMPNNGWQFSHWTICGPNASHGAAPVNWTPTNNPYNVNHGYGDTYRYQAVFTPVGSTVAPSPTPTPTSIGGMGGLSNEMWIIIGLVVVIVVILVGFGVYAGRRRR